MKRAEGGVEERGGERRGEEVKWGDQPKPTSPVSFRRN